MYWDSIKHTYGLEEVLSTLTIIYLFPDHYPKVKMGKKGKNTVKKKVARQEAKMAEKDKQDLKRGLPARLDAVLAKGKEETKDVDLFDDPPPKDECPICLHPFPLEKVCGPLERVRRNVSFVRYSCCGKKICHGCIHAREKEIDKINRKKKANKEPLLPNSCEFCREPRPNDEEEDFARYQKRSELNDGGAMYQLATIHAGDGGRGTKKDNTKALDFFCRAAELGIINAYCRIGRYYHGGVVVEKSERKAVEWYKIAAKKGDSMAHAVLGTDVDLFGDYVLASRHLKIAAEAGHQKSLDKLKWFMKAGMIKNDQFAEILGKCLASQAEMKTDHRDAWAKHEAGGCSKNEIGIIRAALCQKKNESKRT